MSRRILALALVTAAACSSKSDKPHHDPDELNMEDLKTESAVDWAHEQMTELDTRLASADPGRASTTCAVIRPDLARIAKVDQALADTLARKCGRDLAVRSLTVAVEAAEKDAHACSHLGVYDSMIASANAGDDPEVVKLHARAATACAKK